MEDYEIVDAHVHLCRDTAQEKLVFAKKGWPDSWYWGSPDKAERFMDFHNISYMVSVNIMDTGRMAASRLARLPKSASESEIAAAKVEIRDEMVERVKSFNRWACAFGRDHKRLIPYVLADPVLFGDKLVDEVDECAKLGAKGLKIHPDICGHLPDHPNMSAVYDRCIELGLTVLSDTSSHDRNGVSPNGEPINWVPVLQKFPRLRLILAHFCSGYWDERIAMAEQFKQDNFVFDISGGLVDARHPASSHREMPVEQAVRVFRKVGVDRLLFGSDGPSLDPVDTARQIVGLDLTDEEREKILSKNAKAYLGLA